MFYILSTILLSNLYIVFFGYGVVFLYILKRKEADRVCSRCKRSFERHLPVTPLSVSCGRQMTKIKKYCLVPLHVSAKFRLIRQIEKKSFKTNPKERGGGVSASGRW